MGLAMLGSSFIGIGSGCSASSATESAGALDDVMERGQRSERHARALRSAVAADAAGPIENMVEYAALCVEELGEIPFFPKDAQGKYGTFDCRDFLGSNSGSPAAIAGVEGALLPLTVDDVRKDTCDQAKTFPSYDCVEKCDKAQYLSQGCEPGPTVASAENDRGTHWVLLCRKVEDDGNGMLRTKKFNDIAMIGHNPATGKTCFFQNKINEGTNGAQVTHPADRELSERIWEPPQGFCLNCHSADAFVHSPWIDSALRSNGKPIVPKMGQHPDFPVSWLDAPYYVVNMDAQGWSIPKQLVSEEASACTTCHRIADGSMMNSFTPWATGTGIDEGGFFSKITDRYKSFEKSHWMPTRLEGLTAENWPTSKWGKATKHIIDCSNGGGEGCVLKDIPRGPLNPPAPAAR